MCNTRKLMKDKRKPNLIFTLHISWGRRVLSLTFRWPSSFPERKRVAVLLVRKKTKHMPFHCEALPTLTKMAAHRRFADLSSSIQRNTPNSPASTKRTARRSMRKPYYANKMMIRVLESVLGPKIPTTLRIQFSTRLLITTQLWKDRAISRIVTREEELSLVS